MEPTKESKTKTKKRQTSKSSRKSSMSTTSSNMDELLQSGSKKSVVAGAVKEERLTSHRSPTESNQHHRGKAPSLHASSPSSVLQSEQTLESGAHSSDASTPATGSPKSYRWPPPPDTSNNSSTKRLGSRSTTQAAASLGTSEPQEALQKPSGQPEVEATVQQPSNKQQAVLQKEPRKEQEPTLSSEALVNMKPSDAQPDNTKPVDAQAQAQGAIKIAVQEETHLEAKLGPTLKAAVKSDAKPDEPQLESAAPPAVQVPTDGPVLAEAGAGTNDTATQSIPANSMAAPVVRTAATVDTGTDTPHDLWTMHGSTPELPFASPEYALPADVAAAKTAGASAMQPAAKKRIESTANAPSSVVRKSGFGTSEVGGIASTEATVLLDVNPYVRFPLLVMNLIIWLIGLILLLVGAYAYVDTWTQSDIPTQKTTYNIFSLFLIKMEITVMLFGLVTMSLSFCGCVGALRENTCLLNVYSSFITALLLINLVVGLIVFFLPAQIKKVLSDTFSMELIVHYRDSPDFQRLMDSIQERMQCCGISRRNFRDWNANMYFNCSRANPSNERCSVPYSCCKRNTTDQVVSLSCGRNVLNMTDYDAWFQVYTGNCLDSAHRYVRENVTIITGLCLVFVILLAFVQMVTQALIDEILIIRRIYEKFYERAYDMRAAQEQTEPSAN